MFLRSNSDDRSGQGNAWRPLAQRLGVACFMAAAVALAVSATRAGDDDQDADVAGEAGEAAEEVDHLAIAARLIRDGHHARAETVLRQVDLKQPGLALDRHYTLLGLAQLQLGRHAEAVMSLKKAVKHGQTEPVVHSYMAQAFFGLERYHGVLFELAKAGDAGRSAPGLFSMRARSHWELGQRAPALAALEQGLAAFPDREQLERARLTYLIELGLFQEVSRVGATFLNREGATADDYAMVAEGLRRSKQLDQAKDVLEGARLRFPDRPRLTVLLAHTYRDSGNPLVAAMLFEDAVRFDRDHALAAAELYLKAGRVSRAISLNARVTDQRKKMKQRLKILLEIERFAEIAAMEAKLARIGLLSDEDIRYALAYAHFETGQFDEAEAHLKRLSDPKLFEKALHLRRAMQRCRDAEWQRH